MSTDRKAAVAIGALFIIGTAAGVASKFATAGLLDAPLAAVAAQAARVQLGAALVLVMGLALAVIPAAAYPVLKPHNETLAIGYVIFRGGLETFTYLAMVLSWLLLAGVAQQSAAAGATTTSQVGGLGTVLGAAQAPITAIGDIVFSIGTFMFCYVLYRARLVPRWLSLWGLMGAVMYGTVGVILIFGPHIELAYMPLALQEMVIAVWLIAKGFEPAAGDAQAGRALAPTALRAAEVR